MKKIIIFGAMALTVGMFIYSCEKEEIKSDEKTTQKSENFNAKSASNANSNANLPDDIITPAFWDIFEPIRVHRGTTERNRDGKNCGCNECFGICNAPVEVGGVGAVIGIQELPNNRALIVFLHRKPNHFESEFGVDSEVILSSASSKKTYRIKPGLYEAIDNSGELTLPSGKRARYFGSVIVDLN